MKIPESVRIGGVEYAIRYGENVRIGNELLYGKIDYDKCEITLSTTDGNSHQHQCITLLHEILHGICNHNGMEIEDEEAVVDMFAKGIYQVLQDNGRREHIRRHLYKYEYGMKIDLWLQMEPLMWRIISWHRWKKSRPPKTWE